jgi:hypothetical protein
VSQARSNCPKWDQEDLKKMNIVETATIAGLYKWVEKKNNFLN